MKKSTTRHRQRTLALVLALLLVAGCFGPGRMEYDIGAYNKATVDGETNMLLYNIGRLHDKQPPHFMMLSSVSQSRSFSASGGFQWSEALAALNPFTETARTVRGATVTTTTSALNTGGTWTAGPFSAGSVESPTITFVPIQGQEFANRFESPLRDTFAYFFEDENFFNTPDDKKALVQLFAQSLYLLHGGAPAGPLKCRRGSKGSTGYYVNRTKESLDGNDWHTPDYYYSDFGSCIDEILHTQDLNYVRIDGHHTFPTKAGADPLAADVVSALQAGYEWTTGDDGFVLTNPVKIPAWLDYDPDFAPHTHSDPTLDPVLIHRTGEPKAVDLVYASPKGHTWKQYTDGKGKLSYALVPDGYSIKGGQLVKLDKCGAIECSNGTCKGGRCVHGKCVADSCNASECESGKCGADKRKLLYSDKIIAGVWPVPQDYFYIELRHNSEQPLHSSDVYNSTAEGACFGGAEGPDSHNRVVCGYLKIGNLLQIMKRLADSACDGTVHAQGDCGENGPFAIGSRVPSWADRSAQIEDDKHIWEPAHSPQSDREGWERDRKTFAMLYTLYQMSLVNTSQLVAGAPPITISK